MAFDYTKMLMRNPSFVTKQRRLQSMVRKSMKEYRALHSVCEWTGKTKNLEVHHIVPVSIAPQLAALHSNMIVLEKKAHLHFAHRGSYKNYENNLYGCIEAGELIQTVAYKEAA